MNIIFAGWWFGTCFVCPDIGNVIIPTDELICFRGVGIPPTSIEYQHLDKFEGHHVATGMMRIGLGLPSGYFT